MPGRGENDTDPRVVTSLKPGKIGALVTKSVRRIRIAMAAPRPHVTGLRIAHAQLSG